MDTAHEGGKWAEIPTDILNEIGDYIHSYGDYVRFCAVCKFWRLQLPKIPKYLKSPLLVLPFDDENSSTRPFYHVGEKKVIHRLELPETKNTLIFGSSYGWLITVGLDGELQMLEPFTKVRINLPPLSTFPDIVNYKIRNRDNRYTLKKMNGLIYHVDKSSMQRSQIQKIVLSSSPNDIDQDFMAIAIYGDFGRLAYCVSNDKTWKDFTMPNARPYYQDAIFHKGMIYAINHKGEIHEYDIHTKVGRMIEFVGRIDCSSCRYLLSKGDDLLLIVRIIIENLGMQSETNRFYHTRGFKVFKLSQSTWTTVKSLDNYAIVVGFNSSIHYELPYGGGNWIYFSDDRCENHYWNNKKRGGHDNGIFNLQDGTIEVFDSLLYPGDDAVFPIPIWLS